MTLPSLDETQISALSQLLAGAPGRALDDSALSAAHIALFRHLVESVGLTDDRYPALHAALDETAPRVTPPAPLADTGGYTTGGWINYIGTQAGSGKLASSAFCSVTDPTARIEAHLLIVDALTYRPLAQGYASTYGQQTLTVATNDPQAAVALPGQRLSALLFWVYWTPSGTPVRGATFSAYALNTLADPTVTAPVISPKRAVGPTDSVQIGLSRATGSLDDIDYWFDYVDPMKDPLVLPFSGSVTFNHPIMLPLKNFSASFVLARQQGGLNAILPGSAENARLQALFTPSGNTLSWTIATINFPISPWTSDTLTFFAFQMSLTLDDGTPSGTTGAAAVVSAATPDVNPQDGVSWIKPIMYIWHCLAPDTAITMSDGSRRAIVALAGGELVRVPGGGAAPVRATLRQRHRGEAIRLVFSDGTTLIGAGTHPVITPKGLVAFADLAEGDVVEGDPSPRTVTAAERIAYDGELVNLILDEDAGATTMYANGIAVGDHNAQTALDRRRRTDPAYVRSRLPAVLLTDYDSYLADTARS